MIIRLFICLTGLISILPSSAQEKDPAFQNPVDDPALPRVLLIGDSISIGYTVGVREELKGKANVHRIGINSGPTTTALEQMDSWLGDKKWDVIHFNWGLHDLCYRVGDKRDKKNGKPMVELEDYEKNLETLVERMKKTGAKLIFATTTPVPEGEAGRKVGDDLRYNEVALRVMKKNGVAINDLHAVMVGQMEQFAIRPGNVHFKPEGYALLAKQVAKSIEQALESP